MKPKVGWLAGLALAAGFTLTGCYGKRVDALEAAAAAMETRLARSEANLAKLNELHRWIYNEWYPKYVLLHKKVWGSGGSDPPPPPTPPPPFE